MFESTPVKNLFSDYVALDKTSKKVLDKNSISKKNSIRTWSLLSPVLTNINIQKSDFKNFSKYEKIFLVSSQYGNSPGCLSEDGELDLKIKETIIKLKNENYLFLIKPHPIALKKERLMKKLSIFCRNNSNCFLITEYGIADLANIIDVHLTSSSGVTRECAFYGIKSLLYSDDNFLFSGIDYHLKLEIENNMAYRVNAFKTNDILRLLLCLKKRDSHYKNYLREIEPEFNNVTDLFKKILDSKYLTSCRET